MKHIEPNPTNLSLAIVYAFFGILSFFVLKISAKYFVRGNNPEKHKKKEANPSKVSKSYLQAVNFSKVFWKTHFFKNTLIGSILNENKKYLLKQIFVLSSMAVSCFNINYYIIWPWAVGLATSLSGLIVSEIIIPLVSGPKQSQEIAEQSEMASNINEPSNMGSIQIQINTRLELVLSSQGEETGVKKIEGKPKSSSTEKSANFQLFFIMFMAFVSQVFICVCIIKLSLSVSNSGVLNLISFGISIVIDQIAVRTGMGLTSYLVCLALHKTKIVNLLENSIFYSCCSEAILKDIKRVHEEMEIEALAEAKNNKIINENQVSKKMVNETGAKMIKQNQFAYEQKVSDQISAPSGSIPNQMAVLEEQDEDEAEPEAQGQVHPEPENSQNHAQQTIEIPKDETNYFELYEHDVETFTEQIITTERSNGKVKKFKKRVVKPEEKIKSDPLIYFPYEEHKLSNHKNSVKHELKQFQNQLSLFDKEKTSIADNLLKNIDVLECVDDSIVTEEQEVVGTILGEKNFNIKTLTINQKAQIPPTSRPGYSATKRSVSKQSIGIKKVKKVSPYLVDLQSEAVKPSKGSKSKKLMVSKMNKENANQTNNSFMPQETIEASRMTRNNWVKN